LEIVPASRNTFAENDRKSFLTEVQVLVSRPLLEQVVARLGNSDDVSKDLGTDPVHDLERMLGTERVEG
jgi:hypothetical protein